KRIKQPLPIRELTADQIRKYDCGRNFQIAFPKQKRIGRVSVPTLDLFLKWANKNAPKLFLLLEIKVTVGPGASGTGIAAEEYAGVIDELLKKHLAWNRTILQSSNLIVIEIAKLFAPDLPLSVVEYNEKEFYRVAE